MAPPPTLVTCPWCTLETTDPDEFRTHLMVEHRKSALATYVLEAEHGALEESDAASAESDEDRPERETELLAR